MFQPSTNTHHVWSEKYQRWYATRGADSNGKFMEWMPQGWYPTQQVAASTELSLQPASSNAARALPKGQGPTLQGNYNAQLGSNAGNLHYEAIDQSYFVRDRKFFEEGRVFSVLMTEEAGTANRVTDYNSSISVVNYAKNYVHARVRRFVVVRAKREFCYACPIFTYAGRATLKRGVNPEEHGIVYSDGTEPRYVPGETGMNKPSIAVAMSAGVPMLDIASRIYYGIHHPIQYNVKVKELGLVLPHHRPVLIGNWRAEDEGETQQAAEVTATAEDPESSHDSEDPEEGEEEKEEEGGEDEDDVSNKTGKAQSSSGYSNRHQNLYGYPATRNAYGSGRAREDSYTLDGWEHYGW